MVLSHVLLLLNIESRMLCGVMIICAVKTKVWTSHQKWCAVQNKHTDLCASSIILSVSWAKTKGHQYKRGTNSMPNFGTIVDIIIHEVEVVYIVFKKLCTLSFDHHYHSYCVTYIEPACYIAMQVPDFYDNHPLSLYHSPNNDSDLFVPIRSII